MAVGLTYASGPLKESTAIPSSAFSKGDLLMYDSNSSLSRSPAIVGAGSIVGVAKSASTASINNQVPFIVAMERTVFWSDATTGSQFTPGESVDVEYTGARWFVTTSANTPTLRVMPDGGSNEVIGSDVSRVRVTFDPSVVLWSN